MTTIFEVLQYSKQSNIRSTIAKFERTIGTILGRTIASTIVFELFLDALSKVLEVYLDALSKVLEVFLDARSKVLEVLFDALSKVLDVFLDELSKVLEVLKCSTPASTPIVAGQNCIPFFHVLKR